jgi:ATP-dependent DNA helicase MPH1
MPAPVMQEMNIDPWEDEVKNRGNKRKSKGPAADKAPKRQRGAPVPEGIAGFVKASALTTKGRKTGVRKGKGRAATPMTDSDLDASLPDLNDLEPTVRYSSDSEPKTPASKRKSSSRATATTNRTNSTRKNKKSTRKSFASSSSDEAMAEPSEEEDFDKIVFGGAPPPTLPASSATVNFTNNTQTSDAHGITNDDDQTTPLRPPGHKRHAHDTQQIPVPTTGQSNHSEFSQLDARWMLDLEDDEFQPQMPGAQILAKPFKAPTFKAPSAKATATYGAMGPPSSVRRSSASVPGAAEIPTSDASPIIVRRRGANRPAIAPSSPDPDTSPTTEAGFRPASRMLAATPDTISPVAPARRRKINGRAPNRFIEDDVDVSGEDDGDDDEDDEDDEEDESDRRFAGHFQPTQAPKGYNQSRAYLAGLATQATKDGPAFHDRGHKHTEFLSKARRPILLSQEDTQQGPSSDYEGSFVCGDETIDYDSDMDDDLVE